MSSLGGVCGVDSKSATCVWIGFRYFLIINFVLKIILNSDIILA